MFPFATLRALAARRDLRRSRSWRLAERSDSARFTTDVMFTQTRPMDDRQTQSESGPIRRSLVSMGENKFPRKHAFPVGFFALTHVAAESGRPARSAGPERRPTPIVRLNQSRICSMGSGRGDRALE